MIKIAKYLILLTITLFLMFSCNRENNQDKKSTNSDTNKLNTCNSSDKINLLLGNIFSKKYIFPVIGADTNYQNQNRYNYLIASGLTLPNQDYYIKIRPTLSLTNLDSIKILPISEDSIKNKGISKVYLALSKTNIDTTNVEIIVGYTVHEKVPLTEATFKYSFDENNCKWIMKDSTFRFY